MNSTVNLEVDRKEFSLNTFQWKNWILAGFGTVGLNCILFLLLPVLMHPSADKGRLEEIIERVDVIRLKKQEPPPRKKEPQPPERQKEKPEEKKAKPKAPQPLIQKKLVLPFQLNTRLPALATDFQVPFSENISYGIKGSGPVDMSQLDRPLTPISRIPPVYPIRARRKGIEGWVRVRFDVDEQGVISQLQIIEGNPQGVFNKSVIQCVSKWRFKAGTVEGIPVRSRMETTIRFEME